MSPSFSENSEGSRPLSPASTSFRPTGGRVGAGAWTSVFRRSPKDSIFVGEQEHGFGFPPDEVLGDDPRSVLEHDIEWLVDELCETSVAWAERLPACPIHPGIHPLVVEVDDRRVTAMCPEAGVDVRTSSY